MPATQFLKSNLTPSIQVERITKFTPADLADLCDATEIAIKDGIGFNWLNPPARPVLEQYWQGVLMVVPERILFGGRLDGILCASVQLVQPPASKQNSAFAATITNHFVAPWARGHGLARSLLIAAEDEARSQGFGMVNLSVRATQDAARTLYEESGYQCWGTQPAYERVGDSIVSGHHFSKALGPTLIPTLSRLTAVEEM
jgi:ribosomal protein S18 acetylase RimI-like enzyme